jgi:hypothetical protein
MLKCATNVRERWTSDGRNEMNGGFLIVKSQGPTDGLTDALELVSDAAFKAKEYRELANGLFPGASWAGDTGKAELSGVRLLLESTDAGLFVTFSGAAVPAHLMRVMVAGWPSQTRWLSAPILARSCRSVS